MARLNWGTSGERYYEAGADRGVLYVQGEDGVAWSGLVSVKEAPSGGSPTPYYLDGVKYLNLATAEEYAATITAFSSPPEFDKCDGTSSIHNGLFITQQIRKPFGFSYRTKVGNDTEGLDHGYKIHLIYNALAAPSSRDNNTLNASPSPIVFSWPITTTPPVFSGYKPSSHMVIDSRQTPSSILSQVEGILYGSITDAPRLPLPSELVTLFDSPIPVGTMDVTDNADGTYTISGDGVTQIDADTYQITGDSVVANGDGTYTIASA